INTMLHMKLNSAVSVFAVAAAFSVLLPPSNAYCGVCFLPDCQDSDTVQGDINMNVNEDSEYCEKKGYTYYLSGECPQYQAKVGTCSRDDHYLKCDPVKWCTDNGYNTQTCSLPSFVDGQCPNGKPYYKQCKEDRPRACREAGYVNSCSSGRLYATTNRCQWDSSYGKCCTASPSAGCPSNYKVTCDASRGSSGTDTCGYTCYRCCSDECSRGSKNYSGSYATTTECGSTCRYCKDCTSGSTSYSGSYVGSSECGNCYSCSDTCRSGQKSVSCSSTYVKTKVSSTECGTSCYECQYNTDCSVTSKSCSYGCSSYNSCSKCTSCNSCSPLANQTNCSYGTETCSNGCGGTRTCCKSNPWVVYAKYQDYICKPFDPWPDRDTNTDYHMQQCKKNGMTCILDKPVGMTKTGYGCYNKETGVYNGIEVTTWGHAIFNGGKYYDSIAACNSDYGSNYKSYSCTYTGYCEYRCNNNFCTTDGHLPTDYWGDYSTCKESNRF
ncbi:MAG: hypothetical protein IJ479_09590, partial [Alphaproteobacteria bacterium]|nr:hypothetical protein [Alphaproteobacteria bacterium]